MGRQKALEGTGVILSLLCSDKSPEKIYLDKKKRFIDKRKSETIPSNYELTLKNPANKLVTNCVSLKCFDTILQNPLFYF